VTSSDVSQACGGVTSSGGMFILRIMSPAKYLNVLKLNDNRIQVGLVYRPAETLLHTHGKKLN
jgi:hypothetical protein